MRHEIQLNFPDKRQWTVSQEIYTDEIGADITHIEANSRVGDMVDIYVSDMPDGETAEDQAFSNYVDMVGFSEDDPEGFQPIRKYRFRASKAWGFEALCEDERPMKFLAQEIAKGVLGVFCLASADESGLLKLEETVATEFRLL